MRLEVFEHRTSAKQFKNINETYRKNTWHVNCFDCFHARIDAVKCHMVSRTRGSAALAATALNCRDCGCCEVAATVVVIPTTCLMHATSIPTETLPPLMHTSNILTLALPKAVVHFPRMIHTDTILVPAFPKQPS